jgi:glycosyltransferase involved in cell wall biosynthesis
MMGKGKEHCMYVGIMHYAAPPVVGGVESVIHSHAQCISHGGHTVKILAGRGETTDARCPVELLPLLDSRHPRVLNVKAALDTGTVPEDFTPLVEQIRRDLEMALTGIDILIAHNVASLNKNLALTAALYQISQKPNHPQIILWHHDLAWTTPRYQPELFDGYPWDLLRTAWPGVTQVVVSEERRKEYSTLAHLSPEVIQVIPAGIDLEEFLGLNRQVSQLCSQLNLFQAAPLLLTPVRITKRKNLELAIETTAHLREHLPSAQLVITGPLGAHNPANQEYLKKLVSLRKMLGMTDHIHLMAEHIPDGLEMDSVAGFYRLADALLLPSREEGFGIPILEAGIAMKPVFCSDLPPLRALAGPWAKYFSPDDKPGKIARLIAQALTESPVYNLRIKIRSAFTWEAIYQTRIAPLMNRVL